MEALYILAAGVFGALIGSFLNVVIYRTPLTLLTGWRKECETFLRENTDVDLPEETAEDKSFNLAFPASHCPSCKKPIPAWCNIPILSYLMLKGKCLHCKTPISLRYPFVELLTAGVTAFIYIAYSLSYEALAVMLFSWVLIALIFIDIDHQLLPDNMTLPLLWLGLVLNSVTMFTDLKSALYGAVFGYLSLWSVYWLFKLVTGKEGMGFGDFKLLAALGAWMGWQQLPLIIILSSLVGAILGILNIVLSGKDKNTPIPFGPYLAIAGWIAFFWGADIQQAYLGTL